MRTYNITKTHISQLITVSATDVLLKIIDDFTVNNVKMYRCIPNNITVCDPTTGFKFILDLKFGLPRNDFYKQSTVICWYAACCYQGNRSCLNVRLQDSMIYQLAILN